MSKNRRRANRRRAGNPLPTASTPSQEELKANCFQGERLTVLLEKISREIELAKVSKGDLPDKIWIKQQFAIGVNDVTRVLERMPSAEVGHSVERPPVICNGRKLPLVPLQAVLLASDCNPRWLTKHIPSLASSRRVPVIFLKDNQGGSLRLGELVKLRTAMAIGVKARGSRINKVVDEVLHVNALEASDALEAGCCLESLFQSS